MKKILITLILIIPLRIHAVETSASSAILMEMDSNRILYSKNVNDVRSVASISKIMTAIVAIESGKINNEVVIGDEINSAYGSGIYITKGEKITIKDLLYGLMLRSGNDAAIAIATHVAGNQEKFVQMMNIKAKEIGMNNTTFNNPSGLDEEEGNYSTAYDMAKLTSYAMKNETYREITKTKEYELKTNKNTYKWTNKNKLLKTYKYTTGGKTGYTEIAHRTLVTTATKDNIDLVVVTLNDGNDWYDHIELFEYGFNNYKKYKILDKDTFNLYDKNYYKLYKLYIKNNFNYILLDNEKDSIKIQYELEKIRDIKDNLKVGEAKIYVGDEIIHTEDIFVVKKEQTKLGILEKIRKWFNNLW